MVTNQRLYSLGKPPSLDTLEALCSQNTPIEAYPHASHVVSNVPVYSAPALLPADFSAIQDEWYSILLSGPGVFVIKNLYPDEETISTTNAIFEEIINREKN